jgi:hypothetical protein
MQLLDLKLTHLNLYCPVTGEPISVENDNVYDNARSLIGYWIDEILHEPFIKDDSLQQAWNTFLENFETENNDLPGYDEIETFLIAYPKPNWVLYKISTVDEENGPICGTTWFIVDMNVTI